MPPENQDQPSTMQSEDQQRRFAQVIAQAWLDPAFKERLAAEPRIVMAEYGIDVAPDVELQVVEDTDDLVHICLPPSEETPGFGDSGLRDV